MDDYISRESVLKYCEAIKENASGQIRDWKALTEEYKRPISIETVMQRERDMESAIMCFRALPSADVRPVVTCDRCRYSIRQDLFELWCNGFCHPARLVRPDDFCSHGEESS